MPSPARSRSRSLSGSPKRSPAQKAVAPKAAALKKKKSSKPKVAPAHPSTLNMIVAAINGMHNRKGSSVQAIRKYIMANFKGINANRLGVAIKLALAKGLQSGALIRPKGSAAHGATGRYRVGKVPSAAKPKKAKTASKNKSNNAKKSKKAKKPSVKKSKKAKKPKSPKKKAAKKSAKKRTPKKPKAPKKSPKKAAKKRTPKKAAKKSAKAKK